MTNFATIMKTTYGADGVQHHYILYFIKIRRLTRKILSEYLLTPINFAS
jgi:hypothetical protein